MLSVVILNVIWLNVVAPLKSTNVYKDKEELSATKSTYEHLTIVTGVGAPYHKINQDVLS
jgi:hypothetical protein